MLEELLVIGLAAVLIENVLLTQFLGICPFLGVSKKSESAIGMGLAVIFVMLLSSTITWTIDKFILVEFELVYMRTIVFILVISAVVQFVEMFVKKTAPLIHKMLGIYLPLITTNCAILGVALINVQKIEYQLSFPKMLVYTTGIAVGFTLVMYVFSTIRERLMYADVPKAFKGTPIALITAGIMALAFFGFQGVL
jgi:Na+-translocating ferredoxin:NAD+ oxidoreductase subunit A